MQRLLMGAALTSALALGTTAARAEVHLEAELSTELPIAISGRISLELPARVRVATSLGFMPPPYVDLTNAILVEAGAYDDNTAQLIASALDMALVWRLQVGWRPLSDWGWYVDGGYSLASLGGGLSGTELMALALGAAPPQGPARVELKASSTLHLVVAETGYTWRFFDALVLRAGLGFAGTVAASTSVEPPAGRVAATVTEALRGQLEAYLDDTYTSYVFTPTIHMGLGYRFF